MGYRAEFYSGPALLVPIECDIHEFLEESNIDDLIVFSREEEHSKFNYLIPDDLSKLDDDFKRYGHFVDSISPNMSLIIGAISIHKSEIEFIEKFNKSIRLIKEKFASITEIRYVVLTGGC